MFRDVVNVLSTYAMSLISENSGKDTDTDTENDEDNKSDSNERINKNSNNIENDTDNGTHITQSMSREPSKNCLKLLETLRTFNNTIAIPAERELIDHYMHADGKWPERYVRTYELLLLSSVFFGDTCFVLLAFIIITIIIIIFKIP